jgi:tetratricopeptide (TPR) repeat protein
MSYRTWPTPASSIDFSPLSTQDSVTEFMQQDIASASTWLEPVRGANVGRYIVLGTVGTGAMGIVLAAYDPHLDRKVALKLLHNQDATPERLQREAQTLARLDHPNVVSVHDVGLHDGRVFVALDFVQGKNLRQWMDEVAEPRFWREVVTVFSAAARGLAAAHAAGLVHRDFKPENIMLGNGRVRVMDFGLARVDTETSPDDGLAEVRTNTGRHARLDPLTQSGAMPGTPAYMSPEQFRGQVADAQSDQFSFCVALYEALYGERPFADRSWEELRDAVTQGQLRAAPKGSPVPTWLRKVLIRGLATDVLDRFESVEALLAALADDPTVRHRKWWAAAGLVGLLCGSGWAFAHVIQPGVQACSGMDRKLQGIWDEERRAEVGAAFAGSHLSYAGETAPRVERQLDEYLARWLDTATQACEATQRGEQSPELLDLRMACLDERLDYVRATIDELAHADAAMVEKAVSAVISLPDLGFCSDFSALTAKVRPPESLEVAREVKKIEARLRNVEIQKKFGRYDRALVSSSLLADEAKALGYEPLETRVLLVHAGLLFVQGEYQAGEAAYVRAYQLAVANHMTAEAAQASTELFGAIGDGFMGRPEDASKWAIHAEPASRAVGTTTAMGGYLRASGSVARAAGEYATAREHLEAALKLYEEAQEEVGANTYYIQIADTMQSLGDVAQMMGAYDVAISYYSKTLKQQEGTLGSGHPDVAFTLSKRGNIALITGDYTAARRYYDQSIIITENTQGPHHPYLADSINNLGIVALHQGKLEDAHSYFERALRIRETAFGPESRDAAMSLNNLGTVAQSQGDYDRARVYHQRALAIRTRLLRPDHPDIANSTTNLGLLEQSLGRFAESRPYLESAVRLREQALGPEHPDFAAALDNLGTTLAAMGEHEEAIALQKRALSIYETSLGSNHPEVAVCLDNLSGTYLSFGKYEVAGAYALRELTLAERIAGADQSKVVPALLQLGHIALAENKPEEAQTRFLRVLQIWEATLGKDHPHLGFPLTGLGAALVGQQHYTEAIAYLERALVLRTVNDVDPATLADTQFALAEALWGAPHEGGRDRQRARDLANVANTTYAGLGTRSSDGLAETKAWLMRHGGLP